MPGCLEFRSSRLGRNHPAREAGSRQRPHAASLGIAPSQPSQRFSLKKPNSVGTVLDRLGKKRDQQSSGYSSFLRVCAKII